MKQNNRRLTMLFITFISIIYICICGNAISGQATKGFLFETCNASLTAAPKLKLAPPSGQKVSQTVQSFLPFNLNWFETILFPQASKMYDKLHSTFKPSPVLGHMTMLIKWVYSKPATARMMTVKLYHVSIFVYRNTPWAALCLFIGPYCENYINI